MAKRADGPGSTDSSGFSFLVATTAGEVFSTANPVQARGFYIAVGKRMASVVDLRDVSAVGDLVARMNHLWRTMGWGEASLEMTPDAVVIRHYGMPVGLDGDFDQHWPEAAAAVLEGAYDHWLRTLGSGDMLQTRFVAWEDGVAELRHGH